MEEQAEIKKQTLSYLLCFINRSAIACGKYVEGNLSRVICLGSYVRDHMSRVIFRALYLEGQMSRVVSPG